MLQAQSVNMNTHLLRYGIENITCATVKGVGSVRDDKEIRDMLKEASKLRDVWLQILTDKSYADQTEMRRAIRNYNALRGVIKSLRWVLNEPLAENPLY
mgnify:CR=1 FL=1